jgi:hypothetical protein
MTKSKPRKTDKMSVTKGKKAEPVNRPTVVRTWWLVDVRETRTLKVFATGPKHARGIVAQVIADLYPPESFHGEPNIVKSFAHTVACDEGRSTRDRR